VRFLSVAEGFTAAIRFRRGDGTPSAAKISSKSAAIISTILSVTIAASC
jgi:hypothetical protein